MFLAYLCLAGGLLAATTPATPTYDMKVAIRPSERFLAVDGEATLPKAEITRSKLCFQLAQQMQDLKLEITFPANLAQKLKPTMLSDNALGTGNFSADLNPAIPPGMRVTIKFSYHGGDKTAFVFHVGPEGSYADGTDIAWYPQFGPELDNNGKFSVDASAAAVGTSTYTIPADLDMVASGLRSAGAKDKTSVSHVYKITHPSSFAFSVDKFHVLRSPGRIPVSLYLKGPRPNEQDLLAGIRRVVDELVSIYGPFPFPEFTLVELSDESLKGAGFGGAGCPGFMLSAGSFLDQGFNMAFFGHEIGHQWWGNQVTHVNEDTGNDLLDEAMAQYGSLYCVQHLVGDKAADNYRWSGYPGYVTSQCGRNFLRVAAAGLDIPIGRMPQSEPGLAHELACEKGFLVYDALRREIGDEAFHAALKAVTRDYAFRSITWAEFKAEVEKASHRDLGWFWTQWLERTGAPYLDVMWSQDGANVTGVLLQRAPAYRLKVPMRFESEDGKSKVMEIASSSLRTPFKFKSEFKVATVEVDPQFKVLHFTKKSETEAKALAPFTKANWLLFTGHVDDAQKALEACLASIPSPDPYGLEFNVRFRLAQLAFRANKFGEAISQADQAVTRPGVDPLLKPAYWQLIMTSAEKMGDKLRARSAAEAGIAAEKELGQLTGVSLSAQKWLAANSKPQRKG